MGAAQQLLIYGAAGVSGTTWDPATLTNGTLSNGNLTMTGGSSGGTPQVLSTTGKTVGSSGKVYFEFLCSTINNSFQTIVGFQQAGAHQYNVYSNGNFSGNGSFIGGYNLVNGDVVMIAVDFNAALVWFGLNGTWSYSGNPSTGANRTFSSIPAGTYKAWFNSQNTAGHVVTARFASGFSYAIPTGFSAWG